jgi:hypothetical protein
VITLYVHIEGLETAMMEVDQMPDITSTCIVGRNPRRRDGKDLPYVYAEVNTIIIPMNRVTFIEVMSEAQEEEFETFIRE